ncbi:MAG: hypothetical protein ACR2IH_05770 [Pyrinomonadaceae bacterium]
MTPLEALEGWLQKHGPLWVNGRSRIVVMAGIVKMPMSGTMLLVYDPSPVNIGRINWRSFCRWYEMGSSVSTRDTANDVEAVFLYVPDDF